MQLDPAIVGGLASDPGLWADFNALCDCGGRLAGTESERQAIQFLAERGAAATGRAVQRLPVPYGGWTGGECRLDLLLEREITVRCHPLVRTKPTPPDGLTAEVVDLGRGTAEEFEAYRADIPGRIVLVRHEYMFAAGHLHRRRKYDWARERGAIGFLISSPFPGGVLVAGSSGRDAEAGIPAAAITLETAAHLAAVQSTDKSSGRPRARLRIATDEATTATETLIFDVPGAGQEWIVLSAHLDGHDLAESAIDNATGVAVALAVARALARAAGRFRLGLRLAFFSVEEWALTGSRLYVDNLPQAERDRIALDVNLDSVGGSPRLTALTSGFVGVDPFLHEVARDCGQQLDLFRPLMANSDHANFAQAGIPALRLVAGFNEPTSNLRHVLTTADTRDKVAPGELVSAALLTAAIVGTAANASDETLRSFRR